MERQKVLLLGDNLRSAVSVSETLTRNGFEVHVLGWWGIPLAKSKWIAHYHCIPRWDLDIENGREKLKEILGQHTFHAVIPVNDDALEIGARFKELISERTEMIGFPDDEKWKYARDKSVLLQQFEALGLGGPKSILIDSLVTLQKQEVPVTFPLIIKPCNSRQLSDESLQINSVQKINSETEWNQWKTSNPILPIMIQEFIGGRELGFNFYAEEGKIIHFYIDEQLHGRIGNEASYRCIAQLSEMEKSNIFDVFSKFISSIYWDGIGMFDFKLDREHVFIIEFNGRFWASIQLSKTTGSDLGHLFVSRRLLKIPLSELEFKSSSKGSLRNLKSDLIFGVKLIRNRELRNFFSWFFSLKNIFSPSEYIEDSPFRDIKFRINIFKWHFINFVKR